MKKVLIVLILFLIPIISTSQSLNELRKIKNVNDFKKVMIENNFQSYEYVGDNKDIETNKDLVVFKKVEGKYGQGWKYSMYWQYKGMVMNWMLTFNKSTKLDFDENGRKIKEYGDYVDIVDSIKNECKYLEILNLKGKDYVCYICEDNVKLGFAIDKNDTASIINFN
jgi:hypothetical protein